MTFGEVIKKYRKQKGFTQKQLGDLIGRTQRTIQAYEKGEVLPPLDILEKICQILEVELSDIISKDISDEEFKEVLEQFEQLPQYDEKILSDFAQKINISYETSDSETKEYVEKKFLKVKNAYEKILELTESKTYLTEVEALKDFPLKTIEALYKLKVKELLEKVKDLDKIKTQFNDIQMMHEKIEKADKAIIDQQKDMIQTQKELINYLKEQNKNQFR